MYPPTNKLAPVARDAIPVQEKMAVSGFHFTMLPASWQTGSDGIIACHTHRIIDRLHVLRNLLALGAPAPNTQVPIDIADILLIMIMNCHRRAHTDRITRAIVNAAMAP